MQNNQEVPTPTRMGDVFRQNRARRNNNNNSNSNNNSNNNNRRRDRGQQQGRHQRNTNSTNSNHNKSSNMVLEYGKIQSLLDKFGFIYCANRPMDIFFHYSESNQPIHSLQVGQEVQFYVAPAQDIGGGSSGIAGNEKKDKVSAYSVTVLEPGTVVWETEDEPGLRKRGLVERVIRASPTGRDRRDRIAEGTIRVQIDPKGREEEGNENENVDTQKSNIDEGEQNNNDDATGNDTTASATKLTTNTTANANREKGYIVRYTIDDYPEFFNTGALARNDLVEFSIFTEKRSGLKYARNIVMIQTELERLEEQREKALMENASYERGVVTSLKNGFGFLKSNRRHEEIYFHYSHIQLPDEGEHHENEEQEETEDLTLKEGQDMEFYVVSEDDNIGKKRISARQVRFLEKGSVIFHEILATGVTGKVVRCPEASESSVSNSRRRHKTKHQSFKDEGNDGTIRLDKPISFIPAEDYDSKVEVEIEDITLHIDDCPQIDREGSKISIWVKEGDTLLFDVVRDVISNSCRASPTIFLKAESLCAQDDISGQVSVSKEEKIINDQNEIVKQDKEIIDEDSENTSDCSTDDRSAASDEDTSTAIVTPKVRIVGLSPEIRKEGTVVSIKDNFGFIRPIDQNTDVYFRLDEVLPSDITEDIWRNSLTKDKVKKMKSLLFTNGSRVIFDLVSQQPKNTSRNRSKDAIRAERIVVLENKKPPTKSNTDNTCQGYVLMEPAHTSLSNTPSHIVYGGSIGNKKDGGRWDDCVKEKGNKLNEMINNKKEEGSILLLSDPSNLFSASRISYANSSTKSNPDKDPKRGDLICFSKGKGDRARDIRILKRNAAATVKGKISDLDILAGNANFISEDGQVMSMSLSEVISCDIEVLKNDDGLEGILHDSEIVGSEYFIDVLAYFKYHCYFFIKCSILLSVCVSQFADQLIFISIQVLEVVSRMSVQS